MSLYNIMTCLWLDLALPLWLNTSLPCPETVKIPPCCIPVYYRVEVEKQLQFMLDTVIIVESSSSPWMAPAVFVQKKSGEIWLCVDYTELHKKTVKDAYPLP